MKALLPMASVMVRVSGPIGRKDFPEAVRILEECVARDPADVASLSLLAQCHRWSGADEKAIASAQRVLSLQPDDFVSLKLLSALPVMH